MEVAVYPNPQTGTPYLCVLYPCLDDLDTAVEKALVAQSIPYKLIDSSDLPQNAKYIFNALTVDVSGPMPVFDYDMDLALQMASYANSVFWQLQYQDGLAELGFSDLQLAVAMNTPEANRTPDQQAAVQFAYEISAQQSAVQDQLNSATTGDQLNSILTQSIG